MGIAMTTHNRQDMALHSASQIREYSARATFVVVDDGSAIPYPGAHHRNDTPQGIANAKNHCLRLLMADPEIQHIFLFDDDCHPVEYNWWMPYVESGEHHLAYLHDNMNPAAHNVVYDDGTIFAVERGTACMLYFTRHAIETVGGFRPEFGRWSYEHDDLSHRIMNAGLTRFPYQGLSRQRGIWNLDEYEHGMSSMTKAERDPLRHGNKLLFEKHRWDSDYVSYN